MQWQHATSCNNDNNNIKNNDLGILQIYCYLSWLILWKENETTGYKQHETEKMAKMIERKKKIFRSDLWRLEWFWLFYYMLIIKVGTTNQCIPSQERIFVKGRSLCFRLPALLWILPLTSTLTYLLLFHFVWIYTQIFFLKIQITLHKIYFILCV